MKIALCGAHGTGKTTILNLMLSEYPDLTNISGVMRNFWKAHGIDDFEKLPADIRTSFQKHALLGQIKMEDQAGQSFITDRSVMDYLGYCVLSSDMSKVDLELYEYLVAERLKHYTKFIYFPVEFEATQEALRADIKTRNKLATILEELIDRHITKDKVLRVSGSVDKRMSQIKDFVRII
jgi:deoxyadenosine/deoxycytidine kinase